MHLTSGDIQAQLRRRRPGQSHLTTSRDEADLVTILSGVENDITLGSPIALLVHNHDHRPSAYSAMQNIPRPSHADFTYQGKYGIRASSGGGRSSARETIGRVAAGAIAEKWLHERFAISITAFVSSVGEIDLPEQQQCWTREEVDQTAVRCPDPVIAKRMADLIEQVKSEHDSIGGVITCIVTNAPVGWGEPVFQRLEAKLAQAMLSIPASKGFEIGSGFGGARQRGSEHNDLFVAGDDKRLRTATNRSGGVQGGISNGDVIRFRVAFKPAATIGMAQTTSTWDGDQVVLEAAGRHDACIVPRAVPIIEAMTALVLADAAMIQLSRESAASPYP